MGEKINKEFEEYQEDLKTREKKLKLLIHFDPDEEVERAIAELNNKKWFDRLWAYYSGYWIMDSYKSRIF